jgi:esterase
MALAQLYSERVEKLVVGDIAPVAYDHEFDSILAGFRAVELETIKSRGDADTMMGALIQHPGIRQYLLQNLVRENEQWQWRLNLGELERCMASITAYAPGCDQGYAGKSLIIRGELSDYVLPEHEQIIRQCLPDVRIETLPGVGHWVYAEDPAGFVSLLRDFIEP